MSEFAANLTIDVSAGRYAVVAVAALAAGVTDALWFRISNALTFPLIIAGVLYHAAFPAGDGVLFTLLGAGCGFAVLALLFAAGGVGAGDVKLLTGIGAWIGAHDVLVVFVVAAALNGIYSLALISWTKSWRDVPRRLGGMFRQSRDGGSRSESVEHVVEQDARTRRGRLAPMGTMIAFALLILLLRDVLQSPRASVDAAGASPLSAIQG